MVFSSKYQKTAKIAISAQLDTSIFCMTNISIKICRKIDLQIITVCVLQQDIITFKKATSSNIQGLFQGFFHFVYKY